MNDRQTGHTKPIRSDLSQYRLSRCLLKLSRDGELLLVNTLSIRPLLVRQGNRLVEAALQAVGTATATPPGDEQLYELLFDHGIIVRADNPEESPFVNYRYNPASKKSGMSVYLLVSQRCNLRCKYCFAHEFPYRQDKEMSLDVASAAIRKAAHRLTKDGKVSLVFFGGEPLMNWPLIKETIQFVERDIKPNYPGRQFPYHITTNLTHLPDDFVSWVKDYKITLLTDVDGHEAPAHDFLRPTAEGKGSYATIMDNVARLQAEGIDVEIRSTICASNQHQIFDIAARIRELTGVGCVLELVTPFDCRQEPLPEDLLPDIGRYIKNVLAIYRSGTPPVENIFPINKLFEKLREGRGSPVSCGMPWGNMNIVDHQGDVYMCTFLVGQERYRLGNVFDPGETYSNEETAVNRAFGSVHVDFVESCKKCVYRYLCTGHCPITRLAIEALEEKGKQVPRYVKQYSIAKSCKMTRTFYETLLWDLASNKLPVPPEMNGNRAGSQNSCLTA